MPPIRAATSALVLTESPRLSGDTKPALSTCKESSDSGDDVDEHIGDQARQIGVKSRESHPFLVLAHRTQDRTETRAADGPKRQIRRAMPLPQTISQKRAGSAKSADSIPNIEPLKRTTRPSAPPV